MKKLLYILAVISLITATGCQKECDYWYEGKNCTERRAAYLGTYTGTMTVTGAPSFIATTTIKTNSKGVNYIYLDNGIEAELTGWYVFTIKNQNFYASGQFNTISNGSGTITANSLTYSAYINGTYCYFTGTK